MTPTQSNDPASRKSKALARTASQISPHPLGATDRTPDAINEFLFDGILTPLPPSPTPRPQKRMKPALKSTSSTNSRPSVSASVSFSEPERRAVDADVDEGAGSSSDPDDDPSGNYTPNTTHNFRRPRTIVSESTSALKPSPKKRRNHKSSVATSAKRLVTAADPNKAICLLTNAPEPTKSRQFCHVIPRSISDAIVGFAQDQI
jgi:hypothetical protein